MKFSYFYWTCKVTNFEVPSTTTNVKLPQKTDVIFQDQPNNEIHEVCCSANIGETSK